MAVAGEIATAAKEGAFLGFGGDRVSTWETQVMDEVSAALGLPAAGQPTTG
jgi:DNA-directed RNA polymerase subunit E'/Rpb7